MFAKQALFLLNYSGSLEVSFLMSELPKSSYGNIVIPIKKITIFGKYFNLKFI
jgi:hypothetical protein